MTIVVCLSNDADTINLVVDNHKIQVTRDALGSLNFSGNCDILTSALHTALHKFCSALFRLSSAK